MIPYKGTVGEVLRAVREERGLSLEQASAVTRVRLLYLQALENDEVDVLPSAVQARGYLRLYADFLRLPVKPLLDAWPGGQPVFPAAQETGAETFPERPEANEAQVEYAQPEEKIAETVEQPAAETEFSGEAWSAEAPGEQDLPKTGSRLIFSQIGEELRKRRETISLSIEDVVQFTRIRARYVQALEEGRVEELPSLVQGRGMLANYAEFLDLNVDEMLSLFADALQARRLELAAAEKRPVSGRIQSEPQTARVPGWRRFLTPDLLIGGTLFIVFFILVIWGAARVNELTEESIEPTPPSISEILMNTGVMVDETAPAGTPEPTLPAEVATGEPVEITTGPELSGTGTVPAVLSNAPLQISIVASQRTWMQVSVDGSIVFQGRTLPGNAYPFTGYDRIELVCGNGAALTAVFNEQNLGVLGQIGQVVRLVFGEEGVLTPTAQFTLTPTRTSIPTNTLRPTQAPSTPTVTPLIP